jgi:hypothetical protein
MNLWMIVTLIALGIGIAAALRAACRPADEDRAHAAALGETVADILDREAWRQTARRDLHPPLFVEVYDQDGRCNYCGGPTPAPTPRHPRRKYCQDACRKAAWARKNGRLKAPQ